MKIGIGRDKPFDPAEFFSEGWKIIEQDVGSLVLTEIDLVNVTFETCLKPGENSIKGEERIRRLKKMGRVRLDAKIFQTLWKNPGFIPGSWKEEINNEPHFIFFDGTILQPKGGSGRVVLCQCWADGEWHKYPSWLSENSLVNNSSAVLR